MSSERGGWRRLAGEAFVGVIAGIAAGLVTSFVLALGAGRISEVAGYVNPTCDQPRGVKLISATSMTAHAVADNHANFNVAKVLDGNPGSMWIPPLVPPDERVVPEQPSTKNLAVFSQEPAARTLKIRFQDPRDVRLICVGNGLSNSPENYRNWGRVRTLTAWTEGTEPEVSVLRTLDDGAFQNTQEVGFRRGRTEAVFLRLDDAYHGQIVQSFDPDHCETRAEIGEGLPRDATGCILRPTPRAGLSEVLIYERDASGWEVVGRMLPWG